MLGFLVAPLLWYWLWGWKRDIGRIGTVLRISRTGELLLQRSPAESPSQDRFCESSLVFEVRERIEHSDDQWFVYRPSNGGEQVILSGGDVNKPEETLRLLRSVVEETAGPYR